MTYKQIIQNEEILTYIEMADRVLSQLGYTEHAMPHVKKCAEKTGEILLELGYSEREAELGKIAGFMHDIGNVINRADHAQSGAIMAFTILRDIGAQPNEIASIIGAIGNHDEGTANTISPIAAALILADKSDVRRSRVRNTDLLTYDIHDRVNYAVIESNIKVSAKDKKAVLSLTIDTKICPVMDYFEIFLNRMVLCKKAAAYLKVTFELIINGLRIL